MAKGVSDHADWDKDDSYHHFAAKASAEFVFAFLRENVTPQLPSNDQLVRDYEEARNTNPATLLNARFGLVPFQREAREVEWQALTDWCADDETVSMRLFTGPGGSGKTRLFLEWCRQLQGWQAGRVTEERDAERWAALFRQDDCFLVLDYAERRQDLKAVLGDFLKWHQASGAKKRLRIALLAREDAGWWQLLLGDASLRNYLEAYPVLRLNPIKADGPMRQRVFQHAREAFVKQIPGSVKHARPALNLEHERFERMLYLHMAAYRAAVEVDPKTEDLMTWVLDHEAAFWTPTDKFKNKQLEEQRWREKAEWAIGALTLRGGARTRRELENLLARLELDLEDSFPLAMENLYPPPREQRQAFTCLGLEPDLLGETLAQRTLAKPQTDPEYLLTVFADNHPEALTKGFEILGSISVNQPRQAGTWIAALLEPDVNGRALMAVQAALTLSEKTAHARIGQVLTEALQDGGTVEIAKALAFVDDLEGVSLREMQVWVCETQLGTLPEKGNEAERARLLNNLGVNLNALGRREEALVATEEAVALRRRLAAARPDAFTPDLAMSLNNLGIWYSELGRREDALVATEEAVTLYRGLAASRPDAFTPALANSLNNLGGDYSAVGRREEALVATEEAVALDRELAAARPDAFTPDLAGSLTNLGNRYSALGRREEALVATEEAVALYRGLAAARPDAFTPDLASSLNNLGIWYSELGCREEALAATEEAVALRRRLAASRPGAFTPDLASSLSNLGGDYSELGRHEEALVATEEAVALYRRLAAACPDAFTPDLAMSLTNLGLRYSEQGRHKEALAEAKKAVGMYQGLFERWPQAFAQNFGISIRILIAILASLGFDPDEDEVACAAMERFARWKAENEAGEGTLPGA